MEKNKIKQYHNIKLKVLRIKNITIQLSITSTYVNRRVTNSSAPQGGLGGAKIHFSNIKIRQKKKDVKKLSVLRADFLPSFRFLMINFRLDPSLRKFLGALLDTNISREETLETISSSTNNKFNKTNNSPEAMTTHYCIALGPSNRELTFSPFVCCQQ